MLWQTDAVEPIDSPKKGPPKKVSGRGDAVKVKTEPEDEPTTSKSAGKAGKAKSGGKKGKSGAEENGSEGKEIGRKWLFTANWTTRYTFHC